MHLVVLDLQVEYRKKGVDWSWDSIHWSNSGARECRGLSTTRFANRWEMRDCLGSGDCRSCNDAVPGVCCTWCKLIIMAWIDGEGWLNFAFVGDGRVEDKKQADERIWGKNILENWDIREFHVRDNWPFPIRRVRPPIWGLLNPNRQVVPRISHIHSYPPYCSHIHPPSRIPILNSTITAEHKVKSSLSISPCHDLELAPSTAYTESTASTHHCRFSLHSQDYKLTIECSFSFRRASLYDQQPPLH
jgi:hypothetical protein